MELYRDESNNLHRDVGPAVVTPHLIQYVVNNRLHRADGPAVITSNGTKTYYWKGIFIEPALWKSKDTISAAEVFAIKNIELRRCMIEMIGYEAFIARAGNKIKVIHEDKKTGAILYSCQMPEEGSEALVVVKVIDGTPVQDENGNITRKKYFIRVPPTMKNCSHAIAWTFEMEPEEYAKLEAET